MDFNRKGITDRVEFNDEALQNWIIYPLNLSNID